MVAVLFAELSTTRDTSPNLEKCLRSVDLLLWLAGTFLHTMATRSEVTSREDRRRALVATVFGRLLGSRENNACLHRW